MLIQHIPLNYGFKVMMVHGFQANVPAFGTNVMALPRFSGSGNSLFDKAQFFEGKLSEKKSAKQTPVSEIPEAIKQALEKAGHPIWNRPAAKNHTYKIYYYPEPKLVLPEPPPAQDDEPLVVRRIRVDFHEMISDGSESFSRSDSYTRRKSTPPKPLEPAQTFTFSVVGKSAINVKGGKLTLKHKGFEKRGKMPFHLPGILKNVVDGLSNKAQTVKGLVKNMEKSGFTIQPPSKPSSSKD